MPQMGPMNWFELLVMFVLYFLLVVVLFLNLMGSYSGGILDSGMKLNLIYKRYMEEDTSSMTNYSLCKW